MSLNVTANTASALPGFASNVDAANLESAGESTSARGEASISLFNKELREAVDTSVKADSASASKASDKFFSASSSGDGLAELEALLADYLAQLNSLAVEGNEFPLSGSELPAIAAKIRQYLDDLMASQSAGLQAGKSASGLSDVNGANGITGQAGVALLANGGLTIGQNAEQHLAVIIQGLTNLGEGTANTGDAGRSLLLALSQAVKALQRGSDAAVSTSDPLAAAYNPKANWLELSLNPLSALAMSADRVSLDSHSMAMTELAFKDLSTAQSGLLAISGNLRSGALQSSAVATNPVLSQAFNTQLELPLGSAQWGSQIFQRVAWLTGHGIAAAEIHLNPAELGPMQVRVDQRQDSATVVFTSHNSSTREAIEASLPRLRELFSEQGMELLDVDINSGEQQAHANQHDDVDNPAESQTNADLALDKQSDVLMATVSKTETVALRYGLIDAYA